MINMKATHANPYVMEKHYVFTKEYLEAILWELNLIDTRGILDKFKKELNGCDSM